jgi:DnaJ-domain-containing protein 1
MMLPYALFQLGRLLHPAARVAAVVLGGGKLLWNLLGRPARDSREAFDEWERQVEREREAVRRRRLRGEEDSDWVDDFRTSERERERGRERAQRAARERGRGQRERERERERERRRREQGGSWGGAGGGGGGARAAPESNESGGVRFSFDVNDPHAVLGVARGATDAAVSRAFRAEMLKHHPDTLGQGASDEDRKRAVERSKLITRAFQALKKKKRRG